MNNQSLLMRFIPFYAKGMAEIVVNSSTISTTDEYKKILTASTIEESYFAYAFHTFLRKGLDSDGSSICWNAIHLLDKEDWSRFISNIKGETINKQTCLDAIDYGDHVRSLFIIGLRQMEDKEYEALNDFLTRHSNT